MRYLLLSIGVIPCVVVALGALVIVPQFIEVFKAGVGSSFPLATRVLLATYQWWGIAAFVTIGLWLFWPNVARRSAIAVIFGAVSSTALLLFGVYACYAPIYIYSCWLRCP